MKALYIINIMKRLSEGIESNLLLLSELGYEVHIAGDFTQFRGNINDIPAIVHQIDLDRSPFKVQNIKAFKQMTDLMKNEKYDFIHCNTPVGGILGRLCSKLTGINNVLYQAHGFHFYKGASNLHNFIYKNIEGFLALFTDSIITINREDYEAAKKFRLRNHGKVYYVPGVGVNVETYKKIIVDRCSKRNELGIKENSNLIIMIGDLVPNKNYETAINAISKSNIDNLECIICGVGSDEMKLKKMVSSLEMENKIHFLGFRSDVIELLKTSDVLLFTSKREGLSRALMEAMSCKTAIIASSIRGNVDLIDNKGGFLIEYNDINGFSNAIEQMMCNKHLKKSMEEYNLKKINEFSIENVKKEMKKIYMEVLND